MNIQTTRTSEIDSWWLHMDVKRSQSHTINEKQRSMYHLMSIFIPIYPADPRLTYSRVATITRLLYPYGSRLALHRTPKTR